LVVEFGLEKDVFARIVTFGKSFGVHGAVVLGSELLKDYLINYSRAFIYTTALPLPTVVTIKKAHDFLENNLQRKSELKRLIVYFRKKSKESKWRILNSNSSIQCILIPGNNSVRRSAEKLQECGFDVRPILSPTVPKGQERLRICIHYFNTNQQIDSLIYEIERLV
jgi:8-amino-7-oxononanoate synthase